ncbi:MAG: O-antigen ligase family protein [Patescibacteria group bacterium]
MKISSRSLLSNKSNLSMETLIALYAIFFLILTIRHLDWAIMFIIVALPSYLIRSNIFGLPITLLELMILLTFFVWVITNWSRINANLRESLKKKNPPLLEGQIKNGQKIKIRYPFDWEIILLLLFAFTAVGTAGFSPNALGVWKAYFFEPILFFILVLNIFKNNANDTTIKADVNLEKILWPLAVSTFIVSILAIYQKFTGAFIFNEFWATVTTRRVVSFFGYPNAVGLYLGPIVLIMIGWLCCIVKNFQFLILKSIFNFKIFKIFFISLTIAMSILSIYFAKSEGAILGIAVGLVIFGLLAGKKARLATFLLVIIFSSSIYVYLPAKNYLIDKITLNDLSGQIRQQQWHETWQMLKDGRTISGAGLANYQKAIQPYHQAGIFFNKDNDSDFHRKTVFNVAYRKTHWQPTEIYLYPHNILLNFWSELGLAGLLLFAWIIGKYFFISITNYKLQITNYKYLNLGLISAMIVVVVHGLVDVPYFKNDLAIIFWLLVAMMSLINLKCKNQNACRVRHRQAF